MRTEARGLAPLKGTDMKAFKTPNECAELALLCAEFHTHIASSLEIKTQYCYYARVIASMWRKPERFEEFLQVACADAKGAWVLKQYPQADFA